MPDIEVEWRIDLRIFEFHQHIAAANADLRAAEGNKGGNVEGPNTDDVQPGMIGRKPQTTAVFVAVVGRGGNARPGEERRALLQDSAFRQSKDHGHVAP